MGLWDWSSVGCCADFFIFSSRRRHTRCALVTGVQTCALPIWAALDTISFMPLAQADANSGVIISDWYANPAAPTERVKVTVSILDKDLRADALRVAASRQVYSNGPWLSAERSEEGLVGKGGVRTLRARGSADQ